MSKFEEAMTAISHRIALGILLLLFVGLLAAGTAVVMNVIGVL